MNIRKWALVAALSLAVVGIATVNIIWACMGSPRPNCTQTAWIAKMVPGVVVVPAGATSVGVPINLLPFVAWSGPNPPCAVPTAAAIVVTVTCPGLGAQVFPIAAPIPVAQGLQPMIPSVLTVTVPPVIPSVCTVVAEYRVTFAGGLGAGVVIGRGDAEICLVDPSPLDPNLPRLDMTLVTPTDNPFQRCQRGDVTHNWYVLSNNDPADSVELTVTASSEQIARMPGGTAPNVYSISSTVPGTDRFAVSFGDDPVPVGDPTDPGDPVNLPAQTTLIIPPLKLAIVKVNTGINGMCANGSCGELLTKAVGEWQLAGGGTEPALACAQTVLVVDNGADPKIPLVDICDEAKSGPECFWETAIFDDPGSHQSTLPGRDDPNIPLDEFISPGQNPPILAAQPVDFTQPIFDFMRLPESPQSVRYQLLCQFPGQTLNQVQILGFDSLAPDLPLQIPLIRDVGNTPRQLAIDILIPPAFGDIAAMVFENNNLIFDGPLDQLRQDGVPEFNLQSQPQTCRTFTKKLPPPPEAPGGPLLCPLPSEIVWYGRGTREFEVFDCLTDTPLPWAADTDDPRISPVLGSGSAGDPVGLQFTGIPEAPGLVIAKVEIANPATFNQRETVVVAARLLPGQFHITDVDYNSATKMLEIEVAGLWIGCDYLLQSSTDLIPFTDVPGTRFTATSATQTIFLPADANTDPEVYVRVAESP